MRWFDRVAFLLSPRKHRENATLSNSSISTVIRQRINSNVTGRARPGSLWPHLVISVPLLVWPAAAIAQKPAAVELDGLEVNAQKPQPKKTQTRVSPPPQKAPPAPLPSAVSAPAPVTSTASKRPQDRLDVPAGIAVATTEELSNRNLRSVGDLDRLFPDMNVRTQSLSAYTNITVRGQFSGDFDNPSVGLYVDGLPQNRASFGQLLPFGLEQAELLYGPQGTLFGRNSVGGVLNIVTRKPGNDPHFESLSTLSTGERSAGMLASGALIKNALFADVVLADRQKFGKYVDLMSKDNLGDSDDRSARVRLRFAPKGSPLDVMVMAAHDTVKSDEERFVQPKFFRDRLALPDAFVPSRYTMSTDSYGLTASYDLGFAKVASNSGYTDHTLNRTVFGFKAPESRQEFTQEVTLISNPRRGNAIDYTMGVFVQSQDFQRALPANAAQVNQNLNAYAGFGEITWHITDRLDLTPGIRFDYEQASGAFTGAVRQNLEKTSDAWSPKIALSYKLAEPWRVYALYSTGFKPGGIVHSVPAGLSTFTYEPQHTDNYEIGTKYRSSDRRVELWAAAYYNVSRDYQLYGGPVAGIYLRNAGEARTMGSNFTAHLRPTDNLRVTAGLSLSEAVFTRYSNPAVPTENFTGNALPYAPKVTANANVEYAIALGNGLGSLVPHFGVTYLSRVYFDAANVLGQDGYTLLDTGLTWKASESVTARVFVDNLTDQIFTTYGFNPGAPFGDVYQLGQGRTVGASLKVTY